MTTPILKDRKQLAEEWIRRFLAYTPLVTWFGANSVMYAWARATGALVEGSYLLYVALLRRFTLLASAGDFLVDLAAESGTERLGATRARILVCFQPFVGNVLDVVNGATSEIEVDDSSGFQVGDTPRIRSADGSVTEVCGAIISISVGTGPGGGDVIEVPLLAETYAPTTENVDLLARITVPVGTSVATSEGVTFETVETVITGDANPVLAGEGTALALADKAWAEATVAGAIGRVAPLSVTGLTTPIVGIVAVFNPEAGGGGEDEEPELDLKYRAMHRPALLNQETLAWLEALAKEGNSDALRAVKSTTSYAGTMSAKVLRRNAGAFTAVQLAALEDYIKARVRSYMSVSLQNITLTSVEVDAVITLDPGVTLATVYARAASRLAVFVDFRKWSYGQDVDEAALLSIIQQTPGVASLETSSFLPASDVPVAFDSLPAFVRLSLQDSTTGDTINATLSSAF